MTFQKLNINLDDTNNSLLLQQFEQQQIEKNKLKSHRQALLDEKFAKNAQNKELYLQQLKTAQLERTITAYNRAQQAKQKREVFTAQKLLEKQLLEQKIQQKKYQIYEFEREKEVENEERRQKQLTKFQIYQMRCADAAGQKLEFQQSAERKLVEEVRVINRFEKIKKQKILIFEEGETERIEERTAEWKSGEWMVQNGGGGMRSAVW